LERAAGFSLHYQSIRKENPNIEILKSGHIQK
jgi:hypothetical protein